MDLLPILRPVRHLHGGYFLGEERTGSVGEVSEFPSLKIFQSSEGSIAVVELW